MSAPAAAVNETAAHMLALGIDPSTGLPFPNINNILGVMLVGAIIAAYLFGMSSSQAYIYYDRFPKDPLTYKLLVAIIWVLDTFHTVLLSHTIYFYTVTKFGQYASLRAPPVFSFNLQVVVVPIIAAIVQCYFAYRAFSVDRKNLPLSIGIVLSAFTQLGFGFACAILAFTRLKGFNDLHTFNYAVIGWLSSSGVGDVLVSVSLLYNFWRNKTTFTEEDGLMTKVLMYGVHTGLITTVVTFIDLAFVVTMPDTTIANGLNFILGKLYVNTLLYALNRRPALEAHYGGSKSASTGSSTGKPHTGSNTMPTFSINNSSNNNSHSLSSAPRVVVRDPYAPEADADYDSDGKPRSLNGDSDDLVRGGAVPDGRVMFKPDQASEVSYVTMDKSRGLARGDSDYN